MSLSKWWAVVASNTVMSWWPCDGLCPLYIASSSTHTSFADALSCARKNLSASLDTLSGPVAFFLPHLSCISFSSSTVTGWYGASLHCLSSKLLILLNSDCNCFAGCCLQIDSKWAVIWCSHWECESSRCPQRNCCGLSLLCLCACQVTFCCSYCLGLVPLLPLPLAGCLDQLPMLIHWSVGIWPDTSLCL